VMQGLEKNPEERTPTARDMARRLQKVVPVAPASDVAEWVQTMAGNVIGERARRVAIIEQMTPTNVTRPSVPPALLGTTRSTSDPATMTAPAGRRKRLVGLGAAVLLVIAATVVIAMAQSRSAGPRPVAGAAPALGPAQIAQLPAATAAAEAPPAPAAPPSPAEPATADPTPVVVVHPAQVPRSLPTSPAPRKHASGGEFDHVMDSRK
jgi:hypothetical protein